MRWMCVLALVGCAGEPEEVDPRRDGTTWPTEVQAEGRTAKVVTPSIYDGVSDLPLIIVLHGYGASGPVQDAYFQISNRVTEGGFVALVPDGTTDLTGKQFWNGTDVCCDFANTGVDDVAYLTGLIDAVEATIPIDPDRIVLVGHSNGGFMSYRMACDVSDRIAGIASLAGANFSEAEDCAASATVSVLQIHGTDDDTVEYGGGALPVGDGRYPGAVESAGYWADLAGCGDLVDDGRVDYARNLDGDDTSRQAWAGCTDANVALWSVEGGGHIPVFTDAFQADLLDWLLAQRRP